MQKDWIEHRNRCICENKAFFTMCFYYSGTLVVSIFSQEKIVWMLLHIILIVWNMLNKDMSGNMFLNRSVVILTNIPWSNSGRLGKGRRNCTITPLLLRVEIYWGLFPSWSSIVRIHPLRETLHYYVSSFNVGITGGRHFVSVVVSGFI